MSDFRRKWAASEYHTGTLDEHLAARQAMHLEAMAGSNVTFNGSNNNYSSVREYDPKGNMLSFRVVVCYGFSFFLTFIVLVALFSLIDALIMLILPIFWAPAFIGGATLDCITR
jgi:hypothetical protein